MAELEETQLFDNEMIETPESFADLRISDTELSSEEEFSGLGVGEFKATDFNLYNDALKQQLRQFCHHYQIPFLETNLPKTSKNAAKIYSRLVASGDKLLEEFRNTKCEEFLQKLVTQIQEEDQLLHDNPFLARDKWKRFFQNGFQKVEIDS